MANGKSGTSRRDRDDDAPAPRKKDSGSQKSLKKPTSARKAPRDEDGDEDERPRKKSSARSSRGDSARERGAGGPRPDPNAERMKKVFLSVTPIVMLLLLAVGYALSQREDPKPKEIKLDYRADIDACRQMYSQAKAAYDTGSRIEGEGGLPKLKEAKKLCEDAMAKIEVVRTALGDAEQKKTGGPVENYEFEDLDPKLGSLLVMCRKAILERQ